MAKLTIVINELKKLSQRHGGFLLPRHIVESARPKKSPLHSKFDWDDGTAAEHWRLHQARLLLNVCVEYIGPKDARTETDVFVSLKTDRTEKLGYRILADVLSNRKFRNELLANALDEMESFRKKYQNLKELARVFTAMGRVKSHLAKKALRKVA